MPKSSSNPLNDGDVGAEGCSRVGPPVYLTTTELADMLRVSERTLENWRGLGQGPTYIRMGNAGRAKVIYRLDTVLERLKRHEMGGDIFR